MYYTALDLCLILGWDQQLNIRNIVMVSVINIIQMVAGWLQMFYLYKFGYV